MKKISLLTFGLFLCLSLSLPTVCHCATSEENSQTNTISKKMALEAISTFESNPLDADAAKTIGSFAEQSEEVMVEIDTRLFPWMHREEIQNSHLLLVAFIAGNVKKQLSNGVNNSEPYEGVAQIIKTYFQLKKSNNIKEIIEIENWSHLSAEELRNLVSKLLSQE